MLLIKIEDVAKSLNVSTSVVKKYYLLVEQQGYRFKRNTQGHLLFNEKDVKLFKKIILLKNEPGWTVQKAVEKVISSVTDLTVVSEDDITDMTEDITNMTDIKVITESLNDLKKIVTQQNEVIIAQQKQLNDFFKQQDEIKKLETESINNRSELLMQNIRETQELKKMIIESQNKKWWKKIF